MSASAADDDRHTVGLVSFIIALLLGPETKGKVIVVRWRIKVSPTRLSP